VHATKKTVTIEVKDNGYGIPEKDLPFIFDRFYRVQSGEARNIEWNGLGLAIVQSIAEQHGGKVSVESEPGKGSCFSIKLPLRQSQESNVSPKNQNTAKTVLEAHI
jgi:signal transduction histidine kinase